MVKFKIGDVVEVIDPSGDGYGVKMGQRGVVLKVGNPETDLGRGPMITVKMDGTGWNSSMFASRWKNLTQENKTPAGDDPCHINKGLSLDQAMKSGKPFMRPTWIQDGWLGKPWLVVKGRNICFKNTGNAWQPRVEDINALDYILNNEKKKITITSDTLQEAFLDLIDEEGHSKVEWANNPDFKAQMKRLFDKLGLD